MNYDHFQRMVYYADWYVFFPFVVVAGTFGAVFIYEAWKVLLEASQIMEWFDEFKDDE